MYIQEKNFKSKILRSNFKIYNSILLENKEEIQKEYIERIKPLIRLFDIHCKQVEFYQVGFHINLSHSPQIQELMIACLWENVFTLHSALDLILKGALSSARTLLRKVFEFLMIGKYCGLSQNEKFAKEWLLGHNIDLYKVTMKCMVKPDNAEIVRLWKILCLYNHGTAYSIQNSFNWKYHASQTGECFALCFILIGANNHLLKSVILKHNTSAKYNSEYLRPKQTKALNNLYRIQFNIYKKLVSKAAISFVRDYSRNWEYKSI